MKIHIWKHMGHFYDGEIDVEISTHDLIAELERRRPCPQNNCANNGDCTYCVWANGTMKDNFKEAK